MKLLYIVIPFFLIISSSNSQILSTRNIIALPEVDSSASGKIFNSFDFSGEISTGGGSYEGEMTWSYKLMGFLDIYRFSPSSNIAFLMSHELNANPYNDIAFNPRKAIWEENIRYYNTFDNSGIMAGFFHRCKHDIDNADPPKEGVFFPEYQPINRVIILTGLNVGYYHISKFNDFELNQKVIAEYYLLTDDVRSPFGRDSATWEDLKGAIRWTANLEYNLSDAVDLRILSSIGISYLNTDLPTNYDTFNLDYRFEFDVLHNGNGNSVDLFIGVERMFDDVSFVSPVPTNFWNIGLRFRPSSFR